MDSLTILAAWTGAITGVGGLVVQYVRHRKTGAVVRLTATPAYNKDGTLNTVWFEIINKGRQDVQLTEARVANVKMPRRWRRAVLHRFPPAWRRRLISIGFWPGQVRTAGALARGGWPQTLKGLSTARFDAPIFQGGPKEPAEWLAEVDHLYPYARLGTGKLIRARRIRVRR